MKTGKQFVEHYPSMFQNDTEWWAEKLDEHFKEKEIGCKCKEEDKHGTTSIHCCNHCGKPTEDFWINQNKD